MRKFKIDKETSKRIYASALAITMFLTAFSGCKKQNNNTSTTNNLSSIQTLVDETNKKIDILLPEISDEVSDNATIMLLLDIFAKEDENGKISADEISQFKSKIDADDMISEFNSFLDIVSYKAINDGQVKKISEVLPQELNQDKIILSNLESILENIIKYNKQNNEESIVNAFNKIYTLFVEENEIEINGNKFEIRDLTFPSRSVANTYAEIVAYYSRDYITEEQYENIDKRTNDQNNKAYIKSKLEILSNQMIEKSEVDVISLFNDKYVQVSELLKGKVSLSETTIKDLVNYMNLKYLDSDKVAIKDMNTLVGEYDEEKVNDVILAIEAINTYNLKNQDSIIQYSKFLVDNHLSTDTGKTDKLALDFVQFNSIMLLNKTNSEIDYLTLSNNPYFKNIYKYFTKQNFTHVRTDGNRKEINKDVIWQEISDGANFINYQIVLYTLNKLPQVENLDIYIDKTQMNIGESIQYIQNTIMDECKKVNAKEYVLTK